MEKPIHAGEGIIAPNAGWTFGADTPKSFDSHVERSVPFYHEGHELVAQLSDFFIKPDSVGFEIGSSTGALTRKLAQRHPSSVRWVGIEPEPAMVSFANAELEKSPEIKERVTYVQEDACIFPFEKSDFIVSYYTVQFVTPRLRQELINEIYQALNWGGAFVLFEKVRSPDARFQDILTALYTDFKLQQGYTPAEIIAKSRSLKGVLEPFSTQGDIDLLKRAGFVDIVTVFKHICFEGFLCIK